MQRIIKVSGFFKVIFMFLLLLIPALQIYCWVTAPRPDLLFFTGLPHSYEILHTLSNTEKTFGFLVDMIPTSVELFIVYNFIRLFQLYERGEIFSLNNVRYYRHIAYALIIDQFANVLRQGLLGIVLTINNPPGHRVMAISLSQTNVAIWITAFMVLLISWIMAEGCVLREEQRLTV